MLIQNRYLYGIIALCAIPLVVIFLFSFIDIVSGKEEFSLIAFEQLFSNIRLKELGRITERALLVSLFTTIFTFIISYLLVKVTSSKIRSFFLLLITLPLLINESIRVFSWQLVLAENGLVNSVLGKIVGSSIIYFNGSNKYNVIFVMLVSIIPFGIFINTASLNVVPKVYWKSADDLGLSWSNTIINVAIPLSRLSIIATYIISFFLAFSMSSEVNYLGGDSKISIRNLVLSFMSSSTFPAIFLLGTVLITLIISSSFLVKWYSRKQSEL